MSACFDGKEMLVLTMENNTRNGPIFMGNEEQANPDIMQSLGGVLKPSKSNPQNKLWQSPFDITEVIELAKNIGFVHRTSGSWDNGQTLFVVMDKYY